MWDGVKWSGGVGWWGWVKFYKSLIVGGDDFSQEDSGGGKGVHPFRRVVACGGTPFLSQKQTSRMSKQLVDDIENLKKLNLDFLAIEKEAKFAA